MGKGVLRRFWRLGVLIAILVFSQLVQAAGGPSWTQLSPSGGPPPARFQHKAIYDPATDRMVVFGGSSRAGLVPSDVWVLTNADGLGGTPVWSQLTPGSSSPSRRSVPTTVYDPTSNRMIMFGGDPNAGNCFGAANDVWVLSNANGLGGAPTWTQLSPAGTPPSPRSFHTAVYDPVTNRMTVFAGLQACVPPDAQVWVLTNANGLGGTPSWVQMAPAGAAIPARQEHTAVYDPATNRMIVFSGCGPSIGCSDNVVWVLTNANGLGGTPAWTQLTPSGGPMPGRRGHTAVYDPTTNSMTVYGGCCSSAPGGRFNDVWVLSNANGLGGTPTWTQLTPTGGPPTARDYHSAVYNSTTNRMTIYAGEGCIPGTCFDLNDVWVLTNANGVVTVPFANFSATLAINNSQKQFAVGGQFTLGAGGTINLSADQTTIQDDVTVQLGGFSLTIPKGSFHLDPYGIYVFQGTISGVQLAAAIKPQGGGTYGYAFGGQGANNLPTTNPVTVTLTVGNNTGSTSVNAFFQTDD